jgi:hypothetical protein
MCKKFIHFHVPVTQPLFLAVPQESFQSLAVKFDAVWPEIMSHQLFDFVDVVTGPG